MIRSRRLQVCRSCFLPLTNKTSARCLPILSSLQSSLQYRYRSIAKSLRRPRDDSTSSCPSFRRIRPPPWPIRSLLPSSIPIRHREKEALRACLNISSLHKHGLLPPRKAKRLANRLVRTIHGIDTNLGLKGLNPSILFMLYHDETRRRTEIISLIEFLTLAKRSVQRDEIALSLLLHFAQHSSRYPLAFQKSSQLFISQRRIPRNRILRYFSRRNFLSRRIPFSSNELLQWLIVCIVSTPSLQRHLPLLTRIIRLSDTKWTPLRVLNPLIWTYIPPTSDAEFASLKNKYGVQPSVIGRLSYNTLVAEVTHTIRRCNPKKVDIPLMQTFVNHLIQTDRLLYAVLIFDALRENMLGSRLGSELLWKLFQRLLQTHNFEDASRVYSTYLQSHIPNIDNRATRGKSGFGQAHISLVQKQPQMFIDLLRGIRHAQSCQESITALLNILPSTLISTHHTLAAEILHYAAYWNNRTLVQKTLNTLHHPFYDESYVPNPSFTPPDTFSPHLWSAILYAHVQLGLINSSRLILQSMQSYNLHPRPEDMSAIVCGVAKYDLEAGYNLTLDLFQSVTIDAYETLLEIALERGHEAITEWAKGLVAYEGPRESWVRVQRDSDEEMSSPRVFEMESQLSSSLARAEIPTCTARAKGTIIKHVARTEGIRPAILMVLGSRMEFSRDMYDGLYEIAFEREQFEYAMWLANEMIERGWIPQNYRGLKARYKEVVANKRRLGQWDSI